MSLKRASLVLLANNRQILYVHRVPFYLQGGANVTISCLWRTLKFLIETGRMPKDKRLFIQFDGASDNCNQTMVQFASWLCQARIARTVSRRQS